MMKCELNLIFDICSKAAEIYAELENGSRIETSVFFNHSGGESRPVVCLRASTRSGNVLNKILYLSKENLTDVENYWYLYVKMYF